MHSLSRQFLCLRYDSFQMELNDYAFQLEPLVLLAPWGWMIMPSS